MGLGFTMGLTIIGPVSYTHLSMKFDDENPWNGATEKFAPGNIVKGKVARMTDFGAFIELAPVSYTHLDVYKRQVGSKRFNEKYRR